MRKRIFAGMARHAPVLISLCLMIALSASPTRAQGRQVWAYYFGWYGSGTWSDGRLSDRPIAPYNSLDAGVVGRQIDEARSAGIDAFILSWYGAKNGNMTQSSLDILLAQASARGFSIGVSIDMGSGEYHATAGDVVASISEIVNARAGNSAYLRYGGRPVIYFWNQGRFSLGEWQNIRAQADPGRTALWVAEGTDTSVLSVFDGLYLFNTAWAGDPASAMQGWRGRTAGSFFSPTAMPGWDESALAGRTNATSPRGRQDGDFLIRSFSGAASAGTDVILVVSWNEYFENSHVEPSQVFGAAALDTLRGLASTWKGGGSLPVGSSGGAAGVSAPAMAAFRVVGRAPQNATAYTINNPVNLRADASTGADVLIIVPAFTTLPIVGANEDRTWVQIEYGGQTGWMSSSFGSFTTDGAPIPAASVVPDAAAVTPNPAAGTTANAPPTLVPLPTTPPLTGVTYLLNITLWVREAPNADAPIVTSILRDTRVQIVGRSADSQWVQINYHGLVGWMAATYGTIGGDLTAVPVIAPEP
ncbi:MAG: endo-1,3-alpha-glucanase family glycosylhydrolase [Chloroflexota bacterium]|nr:endo-1,3-alpha-glucanase family glycosylhydrolase [Chloroflexota bacterium]